MNMSLRVCVLAIVLLSLVGCQSGTIPMPSIHDQLSSNELSLEQIRKTIKVGAITAGWRVDEISDNRMFATYQIRAHTVVVSIDYSADGYSIRYQSSIQMKVRCGGYDPMKPGKVSTGGSPCPGGAPPTYIHQNYKVWVDELNRSIQVAQYAL